MEEDYQLVTIEEMREILKDRGDLRENEEIFSLRMDEKTGLYYTSYFTDQIPDILHSHLLVEQMMKDPEKVDWVRVTGGYQNFYIAVVEDIYQNPLVWADELPGNIREKMVVVGKIAIEKPISRCYDHFFYDLFYNVRPLWFADSMPLVEDYKIFYDLQYKGMIAWNYLWEEKKTYSRSPESNDFAAKLYTFRWFIGYVERHRGGLKAAEIIRKFREDWPDIVAMRLFHFDDFSEQEREDFREALFEGMDRNMHRWESENTNTEEANTAQPSVFPLLTEQCRKEKKVAAVEAEIRAACRGTAVGLWKTLRNNAALQYIEPLTPWSATDLYSAITDYFGPLPFKVRNFRDARNKR